MTQSDYDHREEGESLFEWPLDSAGMRMGAGELLDSLLGEGLLADEESEGDHVGLWDGKDGEVAAGVSYRTDEFMDEGEW